MKPLKVYIAFSIRDGATGGGNQFLKALRTYFKLIEVYEEDVEKADMVLFNSHQSIDKVAGYKLKYPDKLFIHRIDGPMKLYNIGSDRRDDIVYVANKYLADATIFQSRWSQTQNHTLGLPGTPFETIICNAPDPSIFNRERRIEFSTNRKVRLIATSWSDNWNKGFDVYQWLDEHLDFDKYEMVFVGKSPIQFKNFRNIPPLNSKDIAGKLKENDIFIFASPIEACSNSLLEALHCGLPAVGPNQSSTPELIGMGGETFSSSTEIPDLLEKITKNYHEYQANIHNPSIENVGVLYYDFMTGLHSQVQSGKQRPKQFSWVDYFIVRTVFYRWILSERVNGIVSSFRKGKQSK